MDEPHTLIRKSLIPEVRKISHVLAKAGFRSWAVGGSVRDILLRRAANGSPWENDAKAPGDWDLATDARPERVQELFRRVIPTGILHGTVTVVLNGQNFELTTLRGETSYSDGRHPDAVYYVDDLREDLARRDFTINAIAYDIENDILHDPFDGITDLKNGLIRAVGEPLQRFGEDGLRVLRCARFSATLDMAVDEQTRAAIRPSLASFEKVAQERVQQEWWKALASPRPSRCFSLLRTEGPLEITAPELARCDDERFDVALRLLDEAPSDPVLRLAVLCHWGVPPGASVAPSVGAERVECARRLAQRLRLSKRDATRLAALIAARTDMPEDPGPADHELRSWLSGIGRDHAVEIIRFLPFTAEDHERPELEQLCARVGRMLDSGAPLSVGELDVSGRHLIEAGIPPGPAIGSTLNWLLERVLQRPELNNRAELLEMAKARVRAAESGGR